MIHTNSENVNWIDCDGINPAVMPTPGGLTYEDMIRILDGVAQGRDRQAGDGGYVPAQDERHLMSGLVAARIAAVTMG